MSKGLEEVLSENGVKLIDRGNLKVAICPFHDDSTPSFTIYPNRSYFCFGCRVFGDAVKFLVDKVGMAPDAALDYVGEDYRQERRKREVIKVQDKGKLWPVLYDVAIAYHENLLETPGAISYLNSRGLSNTTIQRYKLGYTDGGVLNISNSLEFALAVEYGVLTHNGYERMSHRITIPNIPEEGLCDYIIGRTITHDKVKYIGTTTPKPIFGLFDVWDSPVLMITEGQMDFLVLREWEFPSVVVGGTHIQRTNLDILKQRNIIIVPDNDAVGIRAATSLKAKLGNKAIILDYATMGSKDVGELAMIGGAREEFMRLVNEQNKWELNLLNPILVAS